MIPYFAYQRKRFFDFCLEKFSISHTFCVKGSHFASNPCRKDEIMRSTDLADELFGGSASLPAGVRLATVRHGGITVTRVEISREGLARPRGRYVTLEMPSVSVLDERDADVIEICAAELSALLPPEGPVLRAAILVQIAGGFLRTGSLAKLGSVAFRSDCHRE